jgi:hypothetical protein
MAVFALPLNSQGTLRVITLSIKENSTSNNNVAFYFCVSTLLQAADSARMLVASDELAKFVDDSNLGLGPSFDAEGLVPDDDDKKISRPEMRFKNLSRVTIRIFPGYGRIDHDESADIWMTMRRLSGVDKRVVVEKGYWGTWVKRLSHGRV